MREAPEEPVESVQEWETHNLGMDARVVREFIVDESIPEGLKNEFWSLWGKDGILANLDDTHARMLRRRTNIILERKQQYMPYYKITPDIIIMAKQIQQAYEARLSRAIGTTRERILLSKQTEEKRIIQESDRNKGMGIWSKTKSFFGFGGGVE